MPSAKKRLPLTLPDELDAALRELADALDKPLATVTVEILTEMIPQLEGLAKYARHMKAGKTAAAKRAMAHMIGDAMAEQLEIAQAAQPARARK